MAKKIYDVVPPKVARKVDKDIKEFLDGEKSSSAARLRASKKTISRKHKPAGFKLALGKKWIYIGIAVFVLVIAGFLYFKLQRANIEIWPKVETLSFEKTISADKTQQSIDVESLAIPATYFEAEESAEQDFPATGNANDEGYAAGTITVYNKIDPPTSLTLKTGTHFISDSGKLFVAEQKIVVPAGKKSGGKVTPGSVDVEIKAVEGGESFNIPPSNFSVPGLKGTAYYYNIYAKSAEAMAGGFAGKVKKITDDDIQGAKDIVVKKATDLAKETLKKQISSDYVLLDNAVTWNTVDDSTEAKAGQVIESFKYKATIKASALAFKKADIDKIAKDYIISQAGEGKALRDSTLNVEYSATVVDISGGKATLNLAFSGGVYKDVDKNSSALLMFGKDENQINQIINSSMGEAVSKVKVNFWPFWTRRAPENQKSVKIELKF